MTWKLLESQSPEIAEFGKARLHNKVAYLATVRKDGSPRVHPFTPIIGEGHFFIFMEPTSPKGNDLKRDPRYAVHCSVDDSSGESGEIILSGKAKFIEDAEIRATAFRLCPYQAKERYILFELEIESAMIKEYPDGEAKKLKWNAKK